MRFHSTDMSHLSNKAKSIRKTRSSLVFIDIKSELFFHKPSKRKKVKFGLYTKNIWLQVHLMKTRPEMRNPEPVIYFLCFQLRYDVRVISIVWKLTELYSLKKLQKNWKLRRTPSKFWQILPMKIYNIRRLIIFWYVINQTLKIFFSQKLTFWPTFVQWVSDPLREPNLVKFHSLSSKKKYSKKLLFQ